MNLQHLHRRVWTWGSALGMAALVTACGGSGGGNPTGTLNMMLTDAPACGYDHVYVTVDHVEISADNSSWTTVPVNANLGRIDLLSLRNGTLLPLGSAPLNAGSYQQVRLVLAANGNTAPWANAAVLSGATTETELKTPSGQQSGYKIVGPFTVQAGTMADLVLDFNACKSIVVAGASGGYLLKPVVSAVTQVVSGAITGSTLPGAQVYAEQQSSAGPVIVTGTVADASTGAFTLSPILQSSTGGTVDVVIVPPPPATGTAGYATDIVQNVPITAGASTALGTITPVASTLNTVSGVVRMTGLPVPANVVASQSISSTARSYELLATATTTGAYSLPLAASGPWLATYSLPLPLTFAAVTASSDVGVYSIAATDANGVSATVSANVSAGSVSNADVLLTP